MSRIEKTARVWIAQTFDAEVNAIESGDAAALARIQTAKVTLTLWVNSMPAPGAPTNAL